MSFPNINYIGNKEKITSWILELIPADVTSFFDAFAGGSSVGYAAKEKGYQVFANDVLSINYNIAKALIENPNIILANDDIDLIFQGKPFEGFMTRNYTDVYFFREECMQLDLYRQNIEKLDNQYKKALAYTLMRRAMVRKMPYSRFNIKWDKVKQLRDEEFSYNTYKRRRHYHNQSFQFHFLDNLQEYNQAVFDNGKENKSSCKDIFEIAPKITADVIYLDPPYTGTLNNYYGFYGLLDDYIANEHIEPFTNSFTDKKNIKDLFGRLFHILQGNYKYIMLSYNNGANPTQDEMMDLLQEVSSEVHVFTRQHVYKLTGKEQKNKNIELLFIAKLK